MCKRGVLREGVFKDTQKKYEYIYIYIYIYIYEKKEDFLSAVIKYMLVNPSDNAVRQRRWTGTEFLIFMSRNGDQ